MLYQQIGLQYMVTNSFTELFKKKLRVLLNFWDRFIIFT